MSGAGLSDEDQGEKPCDQPHRTLPELFRRSIRTIMAWTFFDLKAETKATSLSADGCVHVELRSTRTGVGARPHMDIASFPASPRNKSRQLW